MAEEEHRGDHHDPTDDPRARAELNALKEQMEQLQMRHEEEMAALSQQLRSSGPRDVKVHVLPTVTTPKLKLFSGLPPTSNQEATFEEWRQQVVQTIDDEAISDKAAYVRRSLRGAALQQVNALGSNDAMVIVKHLTTLFGVLKSPEEEYLEICQTRPKKDQALSDLLLLTYNRMKDVQERGQFDGSELQRRLYFAFSKGRVFKRTTSHYTRGGLSRSRWRSHNQCTDPEAEEGVLFQVRGRGPLLSGLHQCPKRQAGGTA